MESMIMAAALFGKVFTTFVNETKWLSTYSFSVESRTDDAGSEIDKIKSIILGDYFIFGYLQVRS